MNYSFVIPYYNSQKTIARTINSIIKENTDDYEIIIVDDGSDEINNPSKILVKNSNIFFYYHNFNKGMCAARNTGIINSHGKYIIILDSDDELVEGWPAIFSKIIYEWPAISQICFAASVNDNNIIASLEPNYKGFQYLADILNERRSGEYLPIFKSEYIKNSLYTDLKMQRSCGLLSYIKFSIENPLWITNDVLRKYHDQQPNSTTSDWTSKYKSRQSAQCLKVVLKEYSHLYLEFAPIKYKELLLKLSVYLKYAELPGYWQEWKNGCSSNTLLKSFIALLMILLGRKFGACIRKISKDMKIIKSYG